MIRKLVVVGALAVAPATLRADFSYVETTRLTGGMIAQISRSLGGLSKSLRKITEPQTTQVYVKGDRMAQVGPTEAQIWDLSKETVTLVNYEEKTYATITLAEMKEASEKLLQRINKSKNRNSNDPELNVKFDVKQTGKVRTIAGMEAREALLTMILEGKDKKSGQTAATEMMSSIWLVNSVPGHEELQEFYRKMGAKMAGRWGMSALDRQAEILAGSDPKMVEWAQKMAKEAEKLNGLHVLQIMKYGSGLDPAKASEITDPSTMPEGPTAGQVAGKAAEESVVGALGRALPGGLGRLGGFGRRNRDKEKEQPAPPPNPQTQPQGAAVLMEMVTELSNFSTAAVDPSKFDIPAGFKKVEHPMAKLAREDRR
ncbi:MAG: hypothetical protein NZV14_19725 [Bryobacteraceae bacterium]|nr:hypothetical protein [Bryobacteraceae bacterium]MDW8380395.1 hypothetical protein [Bryobacterales bacterium]